MNLMEELRLAFTRLHAHRDAAHGVDGGARRQIARLGHDPGTSLRETTVYRQAVVDVNLGHRVEELEDELRRAEDMRSIFGHPYAFTLALLFVAACEGFGAMQILQSLGTPPEQRPLLAIVLVITLIGITKALAHVLKPSKDGPPVPLWKRFLFPLLYTLLILAIVVLRAGGGSDADASQLLSLADAVVLTALTAGPAWAAVEIEARRAPALQLHRQIELVRKRLAETRGRLLRARRHLAEVDAHELRFRRESARSEALYSVEQDIARAKGAPPSA